ncbi:MAG: glycosyl hydrolase, partial [Candidatus Marinimicrobia bacterium]|nr:glycosyl hydrolase [Candidatus Neomarinimicrobiota bacterium]
MKINKLTKHLVSLIIASSLLLSSCAKNPNPQALDSSKLSLSTSQIILTSSGGDRQSLKENVKFTVGSAQGIAVYIYPDSVKQTIDGIGTSFTESSAYVLAHLDPQKRKEVMQNVYGEQGANFSLTRTHMGACDFCVDGKYSYADTPGDTDLRDFNISEDLRGFRTSDHPGIKDTEYDLLPMIQEALSVKRNQDDPELRIIASAWTAPAWMKDIEDWYQLMTPENNYQGTGGSLKPEYVQTYSDYIIKYIEAYKNAGIDIWGLTPVNEPHGNNGQWESMHFTPESQSEFVQNHLGPGLKSAGLSNTKILVYDQNRDGLEHWTDVIFPADQANKYVYGVAVHWYESTFKVYEEVF